MSRGKVVQHVATKDDYRQIIADVSREIQLKYVANEERVKPEFRIYASPFDAPDFGINRWPDRGGVTSFLVLPLDSELPFDYLPDRKVPEKYGFFRNPEGLPYVRFFPSSYHSSKEWGDGLLSGWIDMMSEHPAAESIYKAFKRSIRKNFERIGIFYVGPAAARYLDLGGRVTDSLRGEREADLRRM